MFIVIFTTSLLTFIVLVISSASYLISLICEESDDGTSPDSLAIDTHDFSTTPTASPMAGLSTSTDPSPCINTKHHHQCIQQQIEFNIQQPAQEDINTDPDAANRSIWITTPAAQKSIIINQLGNQASKQLFDEFDAKEMQMGGTGLHWCKSRKALDRLVQLGVPLNVRNSRQETALHVSIRKRKLQVLIGLLCNDAELECKNEHGDTPLLLACKLHDIIACQILLVFDAAYDATDNAGLSARHYVAASCDRHKGKQPQPQLPSASHLILAMLHEMGAKRCSRAPQCTDGCSENGSYNGNSYSRWPDFRKESLHKRHMFVDIIEERKAHHQEPRKSRLLCIDGGGMRGVITCQILIEIQKYLKRPILSYFDWLGGTSVGAYLCCSLSIGTSLTALRRNCFDVKDEVFCGNKPYSSKFLERVLKRTFGPNTRMSDAKDRKLAVTTVIADRDPCQLRFFRNYMSPADLLEQHGYPAEWFNSVSHQSIPLRRQLSIDYIIDETEKDPLMWQAVRASGAAPFFFEPYGPYLDGGIISNNPTMDMLAEFFSYQKAKSFLRLRKKSTDSIERPQTLDLVVSLGTGRGRVIGRQAMIDFGNIASVFSPVELLRSLRAARDLFKKLMQQSCQTEDHILDRAQAWCASLGVPYFRVNPPLASIFSIDDKRDEQLINALWQTKLYMRAMRSQLKQLSALLEPV